MIVAPAVSPAANSAAAEYGRKLAYFQEQRAAYERRLAWLGNLRFAAFAIGFILFWPVLARLIHPVWLVPPVLCLIGLSIAFAGASRKKIYASRAASYYERGLARIEDRWAGTGISGDVYLTENHLYAADLDLFGRGSLFERLCSARTRAGRDTLADWLRAPASAEEVAGRQTAVAELRDRCDWRERLALLGDEVPEGIQTRSITEWGAAIAGPASLSPRWLAPALVAVTFITLVVSSYSIIGVSTLGVALLAQAMFALALRPRVQRALAGVDGRWRDLHELAAILSFMERARFSSPRLVALQRRLMSSGAQPSQRLAELARLMEWLDSAHNTIFGLVAALLLWTTQFALAIEAWRRRTGPALADWLASIGEFEALASMGTYAYENPEDAFPEMIAGDPLFEAEELGHPLLPRSVCVTNDVRLGLHRRLLVVSGSNMSGKSTFLRTVGINAVLAQAGGPVRARRLRLSPLAIGATLRIQDSLQAGRSRFYAEITRLRDIVALGQGPLPLLFLLDEILQGTNSHDRRIGAEAILRTLLQSPSVGLVTTHDLTLTEIADSLAPVAENVHFEDELVNGELYFDYRLRPGVVQRSNALALMRAVGLSVDGVAESPPSRS